VASCFSCFSWSIVSLTSVREPFLALALGGGAHITKSMRYHSSNALKGGVTDGSVAGALISNNGAPSWMTFGNGGGQNNCCVRKNLGLWSRPGVFHKKIKRATWDHIVFQI
jgi:hypothetical protein